MSESQTMENGVGSGVAVGGCDMGEGVGSTAAAVLIDVVAMVADGVGAAAATATAVVPAFSEQPQNKADASKNETNKKPFFIGETPIAKIVMCQRQSSAAISAGVFAV